MTDREYDIVVFGATGFTGTLVAKYLANRSPGEITWAVAGRDRKKLSHLVSQLPTKPDGVIEANSDDPGSLEAMTRRTRVVLTTVGPYVIHGEPLVRACVTTKTDYVDITGEPEFVDKMIVRYDEEARDAGLRIVNCCGFDSIPHDLGALYTVQRLTPDAAIQVRGFVQATGRISGGTWNSALEAFGRVPKVVRAHQRRRRREAQRKDRRVRSVPPTIYFEPAIQAWVCPLPTIDPDVVRRSARVRDDYGPDFRYGHYVRSRSLPRIGLGVAGVAGLFALAQIPPLRHWLQSLKKPGDGPSEAVRRKARFTVSFLGQSNGHEVVTEVSGGDPGYDETAKMVAESAICLVRDRDRLPNFYGVLTPAVAMGNALIDRLQRAGIDFSVRSG